MSAVDFCGCTCGKEGCISRRQAHGLASAYRNGCRCDDCRAAEQVRVNDRKQRINRQTQQTAAKAGQQWTGPEMELVLRDDLSLTEAALMLGRSYRAVSVMRSRCRHDPKYVNVAGEGVA